VRENQTIVVEDLAVKNMVKTASWLRVFLTLGELVRQLDYKCQWYGRTLVKIDRCFPSSKRCGHCGHILSELPLSVREWIALNAAPITTAISMQHNICRRACGT